MQDDLRPISVYVHFPYCLYKCHYCDFNSYAIARDVLMFDRYLDALRDELAFRLSNAMAFPRGTPLATLFLGGGTPSLLAPEQLARLVEMITSVYRRENDTEITLECNPKTITRTSVDAIRQSGVTRISIGIQSFDDRYLAPLGRIHSGDEARETLSIIAESGFENVNTDLMFGFPNQTRDEVLNDLAIAEAFQFPHLSFYNLTPEPGTRFYRDLEQDKLKMPEDDLQLEMMEAGWEQLRAYGFEQYEISNFHREGATPSFHNLAYWRYQPFLGLGAGASGFLYDRVPTYAHGQRTLNVRSPEAYMIGVKTGEFFERETISSDVAMREFMMMGLRTKEGVSMAKFGALFAPHQMTTVFQKPLTHAFERGFLIEAGDHVRATPLGQRFLNTVIESFF